MSTKKKATSFIDRYATREAAKYEHPIPSREAVLDVLGATDQPQSLSELAQALGVRGERDEESFRRRLRAMERDGQVLRNRLGLYGRADRMDMVCGSVIGHADGFGFLAPDDQGDDLFLSPREMKKVMHGDRVLGRVTGVDKRGRREGAVVEVLEHRHQQIVGRFVDEDHTAYITPADKRLSQDIFIPAEGRNGATDGQIVVADILRHPTPRKLAVGRVVEVLGGHMAPGMEVDVAIRKFELPHQWPGDVLEQAKQFSDTVPDAVIEPRRDIRELPLVTIDGKDAKDFDDAVYCQRDGKGWRLYVAIADVSHYVKPDSPLDREAHRRGNSVYFPGRVIPMLPEKLSNGLCSLNPHVNRLCMVCEMHIGAKGKIRDFQFYEAVMRSHARLTYDKVAAMLVDGDKALREQYRELVPQLEELYRLYHVLHAVRLTRGAVDFELPENRIIFDSSRKVERVVAVERNDAHRLIEECMLAANVCAAEFLQDHKVPTPFRVHAGPTEEKLANLREFLFEFGLSLSGGASPVASDYAAVLQTISDWPESRLIQTVMLRSLSQAIYSPDNIGHFALSFASYAHFTSPIRRYPDLIVHRAIKSLLQKKQSRGRVRRSIDKILGKRPGADDLSGHMRQLSEHCSMTGRRADEAVWEVIRWLKTEYMLDKVGDTYEGLITGVTNFGIFVEIGEIFAEGLVHVTALGNDYYHFDPQRHCLVGEHTRQQLRLGDAVSVRVVRVDLDEAKIDLELVSQKSRPARTKPKRKGARRKPVKHKSSGTGKKDTGGKKKKAARKKAGKKKSGKRHMHKRSRR